MKEVVRVIMDEKWIPLVDPWNTPKLSRPMHFVCSVLRTPGLNTWGSAVLPRWEFAFAVYFGSLPGVQAPAGALYGELGSPNSADLTARIADLLAGGNIDPNELRVVHDFVQSGVSAGPAMLRNALALVACCPSYQYL